MDDKSALLNQLRIDRGAAASGPGGGTSPRPGRWLPWLVVLVLLGLAVAAALWWVLKPRGVPVQVVSPTIASDASGAPGSVLDASGYVVARRAATFSSKITGKVTELMIEEGTKVELDQIVARLDDTNVRAQFDQAVAQLDYAKASLAETRVNIANAERDVVRKQGLVAENYISAADLDTSKTALDSLRAQLATGNSSVKVAERAVEYAQRNLDDTVVRAPFSGVITVKAAQVGEIVSPFSAGGGFTRTGIGTLVDMDSLEVEVDVNENFINRVKPDQAVRVHLNAYPDWDIPAYVIAVIPTADRSKATVKVRVGFRNKDPRILPEMGARVAFLDAAPTAGAPAARTGVVVPEAALTVSGDTGVVYLVHGDVVERRAVKLGGKTAGGYLVASGISPGDRLAIAGDGQLVDGTRIQPEGVIGKVGASIAFKTGSAARIGVQE